MLLFVNTHVQTYQRLIRFLKNQFPAQFPVSVRRLRLNTNLDGDCRLCQKATFLIRINRDLLEHEAIETLLHEYAHVLAWDKCQNDQHCNEWGKSYSRIYRLFVNKFLDTSN